MNRLYESGRPRFWDLRDIPLFLSNSINKSTSMTSEELLIHALAAIIFLT